MAKTTFLQPNYNPQTGSVYKAAIDDSIAVLKRFGDAFDAHEQSTPNMTVRVDAGFILNGTTLTEVAAQNTATITAPTTNPRIDRVVVDSLTGVVSVIAGTEAASPTPPAITAGKLPVAQVSLATSTTQITNLLLTDERTINMGFALLAAANIFTATQTLTLSTQFAVPLTVESTYAGADAGPFLELYRNSASPAAADLLGSLIFYGKDSAANKQAYGQLYVRIDDPTSGSEDSTVILGTYVAGALTSAAEWTGNKQTAGTVPLDRMRRGADVSSENASNVTVTSTATTITTVDCGTVVAGDRLFVTAISSFIKGATSGQCTIFAGISTGTAVVQGYHNRTNILSSAEVSASANVNLHLSGVLKITTGGTLILKLAGISDGSDSTVTVALGELHVVLLVGS